MLSLWSVSHLIGEIQARFWGHKVSLPPSTGYGTLGACQEGPVAGEWAGLQAAAAPLHGFGWRPEAEVCQERLQTAEWGNCRVPQGYLPVVSNVRQLCSNSLTAGSMCLSGSWGINSGCSPLITCRNETFILLSSGTMCVITLLWEIKSSSLWWLGRDGFASEDDWTVGKNALFKVFLTIQTLYQLIVTTWFGSRWNFRCTLKKERFDL